MNILQASDLAALGLSIRLALTSVVILMLIGLPLAYWLARTTKSWKVYIEAIVTLPIILPPTVLGFYLLLVLGRNGWFGKLWTSLFGHPMAFSFSGLVVGSVLYSLPFVIKPLQNAFAAIRSSPLEAAATLGAGPLDRFFSLALPLSKPGIITAMTLGFAHTIGEFGVVLMIGGNIPNKTEEIGRAHV